MTTLVWGEVGEKVFEAGVSKGVLYTENNPGVAWNGLIAVEEAEFSSTEPLYFDGVKYADVVEIGEFNGVIKAFTYPDEFLPCEGTMEDQPGFFIYNQPPDRFSLSYQTKIGSDVAGMEAGYKIHILWNLIAVPASRTYETLSFNSDPMEFEWSVSSIPEYIVGFRPTAHVVFDSRKLDPFLLQDIEDVLYGTSTADPFLPTLQGLATFIRNWDRLIIVDNGDGTWTATSNADGVINMVSATEFEITTDTAAYLDADTYTIQSSDKNEEDL